jgi:hypothetical protein
VEVREELDENPRQLSCSQFNFAVKCAESIEGVGLLHEVSFMLSILRLPWKHGRNVLLESKPVTSVLSMTLKRDLTERSLSVEEEWT